MPFANGSERRAAYIAETAFGTTPATPTFKLLRITGGGLRTDKGTSVSDEVRADRNVPDVLMTSQDVTGSYNFEFAADNLDDMLEAVLRGTWTTNVLKNGVTKRSFTFEETSNLGAGQTFSRFVGVVPDTLSIDVTSRQIITGSVGLRGRQETPAAAILTGATYPAAGTTQPATASANVGAVSVPGVTTPFRLKSISFQVANDLRVRDEVGSLFSNEFGAGRFAITGTAMIYFEGNDQYQAVLDHGSTSISLTFGVEANKKYTLLVPKARLGNGERQPGNNTSDFMLSLPFQGVYDGTTAASLQITRAVA